MKIKLYGSEYDGGSVKIRTQLNNLMKIFMYQNHLILFIFLYLGILQCLLIWLFRAFADSTWMNLLTAQNGLV